MKTKTEPFEVLVPAADGKNIAERVVIQVVHEWDEEIGEWLLTPESLQNIDDTKARHMGLLLPYELKALRERLGLTQAQIAEKLEIGEKSWSRWESGRHRPSRSMNLLIKALDAGRLDPVFLSEVTGTKPEWSFLLGRATCRTIEKRTTPTAGCQHDRYSPGYDASNAVDTHLLEAA